MNRSAFGRANLRRGASAFALLAAFAATGAHAGDLVGRVSAAGQGLPLQGATVRIASGASAVTASDGTFRIPALPAGQHELSISYVGAGSQTLTVAVPAEGEVRQDVELTPAAAGMDDRILVTGQRATLFASLSQQRSADNIVSVLSSDAIGRLPDQNVAESARRLPGISVENDQGEGRYVVIRGIDPNLNATSINGVRIPSPEAGDRKVQLDVIDSDILDNIAIAKSLSPDMDGDGIGGNIDIQTASGFDYEDLFIKGRVNGIFTDKTNDLGEHLAVSAFDQFGNGRAALAGSVSWNARSFATDNKEVDGGWSTETAADGDIMFPDALELREYNVTRERLSATLNFDLRPTDNTDLYVRGLYNDFLDQEYRQRLEVPFEDGDFEADDSSAASGIALFSGDVAAQRDIKDREETQRIWSVQGGGQSRFNLWTVDYSAALSHAEEEEPGSIDAATFQANPEDDAPANYRVGVDVSEPLFPTLIYSSEGQNFFNDASNFEFDALEFVEGITEDEEAAFRLDVRRELMFGANSGYVRFGGKVRLREKNYAKDITVYDGFADDLTVADFEADVDYPLDNFGPAAGRGLRDFFNANLGDFEVSPVDTLFASAAEDYVANEDIYALYGMGNMDFGGLRLVAGLRWEQTEFTAEANDLRVFEEYTEAPPVPTIAESGGLPTAASCYDDDGDALAATGATPIDQDILCIGTSSAARDYSDLLPSANARWEIGSNIVARAAYFRSVARPNISQVVPTVSFEQNDEGEREATIGNPLLERQVADNFDAGVEWYFAEGGVLSGGAFYKTIDDYIATQRLEDVTYFGVEFDEVETALNLSEASIKGLELNYQQSLSFLPGLLDGFIVGANYTFLDSEGTLEDGREIPLPKMSENIFGAMLGYERNGFDIRITAQYRDDYLDELNTGGDGIDRYVDSHLQWDARAQYELTPRLTIFADVANLNDEPFTAYLLDGDQELLSQYEDYGWTSSFGLKFQY
jgi:TonB-dependent receptor